MLVYQQIYYPYAEEYRKLHIWLPDSYYYDSDRYPVVYMFDGHNLFEDSQATYGKSWGMKTFLESWEKRIIIVGIECSHNGNDRLFEYSPYKWRRSMSRPPMGDETIRWVIERVKPVIDNEFRTWPHREATGVAGSSMGALMAMHAVLSYNDVFSKAAAVSGGFFRNIKNYERDLNSGSINTDTMIYMSWGENEAGKAARSGNPATDTREARAVYKLERLFQEKGIMTYHYFQENGNHNEESWEKQVPVFMNWLWLSRG